MNARLTTGQPNAICQTDVVVGGGISRRLALLCQLVATWIVGRDQYRKKQACQRQRKRCLSC